MVQIKIRLKIERGIHKMPENLDGFFSYLLHCNLIQWKLYSLLGNQKEEYYSITSLTIEILWKEREVCSQKEASFVCTVQICT